MTGWGEWEGAIEGAIVEGRDHDEIEPRPAKLGGGYRLRLLSRGQETGEWIEMVAASFPSKKA
jgi:hypothetical protein